MVDNDELPSPAATPPADRLAAVEDVGVGGHLGRRVVFRNPDAPFPQRLVAFANSFFLTGDTARQVSWWFARRFAENHFVWSIDVDLTMSIGWGPIWSSRRRSNAS